MRTRLSSFRLQALGQEKEGGGVSCTHGGCWNKRMTQGRSTQVNAGKMKMTRAPAVVGWPRTRQVGLSTPKLEIKRMPKARLLRGSAMVLSPRLFRVVTC